MNKQIVVFGAAVMTTLLGLVVFWQFRGIIISFLVSLALAAALRPLSSRLAGKRFITRAGWILLSVAVVCGVLYLVFLAGEAALLETQFLAATISDQDEWMPSEKGVGSSYAQAFLGQLPPPSQLFSASMSDQGQLVPPFVLSLTQNIGRGLSSGFVILILSVYWTIHKTHFERLWLSLLPSVQRKRARGIWHTIEPDLGAYVRGEVFQVLAAAVMLSLGYWLLGSPYPVLLGVTGALASLIPVVGGFLAVFPVLLVGLLDNLQLALLTSLYALAFLIVLGVWIKPRLFHRGWDNPLLTLLLMAAMAQAFGIIGLVIAPPLSLVIQILWSRLVGRRQVPGTATQLSDLKERHTLVGEAIKAMEEQPLPIVTSSMERLSRLIEKAGPLLEGSSPNAVPPAGTSGLAKLSGPLPDEGGPQIPVKP